MCAAGIHSLYSEEMRVLSTSAALKPLFMESKLKLLLTFFILRRILTDKFKRSVTETGVR